MKICLLDSGIGVIPFIKEIVKNNVKNEYFVYIDSSFFPYGNKTNFELSSHLEMIFLKLERLKIDELLICCNTLSYIYLNGKYKTKVNVKTILEINLESKNEILGTPLLSKNINCLNGKDLAYLIENNKIKEIVKRIKEVGSNNLVMGCTHYSLIKELFLLSYKNIESNEGKLIKKINSTNSKIIFYSSNDNIKKIHEFFPNLVIKEMSF